jgi:hypothetical protein
MCARGACAQRVESSTFGAEYCNGGDERLQTTQEIVSLAGGDGISCAIV